MIREMSNGKFYVKVYDNGYVYLSELINDQWKVCEFDKKEDAEKALQEWKEYKN